jgi:hypothetical protein
MALVTQFSVKTTAGCSSFYVKDITPAYDSGTAPNGYGSPNALATGITAINFQITNMADPTVTRTVIVPTVKTTYDGTRVPGVVQYNITSYQTALSTTYAITSSVSSSSNNNIVYTTTLAHPYTIGKIVTITGSSASTHNITGVITNITTNTFTIDVPGIATANGLTATSQGYTNTTITPTDGVYKFVYTSTNAGVIYSSTCYVVVDCTIGATLDSMLKDINCCSSCSDSNNTKLNMLYQAYILRDKACHLAACQDFTGAQDVLDCLNAMIGTTSCDSCS